MSFLGLVNPAHIYCSWVLCVNHSERAWRGWLSSMWVEQPNVGSLRYMVHFQSASSLWGLGPGLCRAPLDPSVKAPSCGLCSAVASRTWISTWKPWNGFDKQERNIIVFRIWPREPHCIISVVLVLVTSPQWSKKKRIQQLILNLHLKVICRQSWALESHQTWAWVSNVFALHMVSDKTVHFSRPMSHWADPFSGKSNHRLLNSLSTALLPGDKKKLLLAKTVSENTK